MMPHVAVDRPERADAVIFYGVSSRKFRPPPGRELVVERFTPLYSVGRWEP